jgi:hypothetical protein
VAGQVGALYSHPAGHFVLALVVTP